MDKLHDQQKEQISQISYQHTEKLLAKGNFQMVVYDVTTIYFEAQGEDDLRKTGFSKDGKHQHPQIVLGLLVSKGGYPLAYDIFECNKYEGETMLPIIEAFRDKFDFKQMTIVADAGLLSNDNVDQIIEQGHFYILGARIKNETNLIKQKIMVLTLKDGQSAVIKKDEGCSLIIHYSEKRAKKDAHNRESGLKRLEKTTSKW